jgi:S1-C subfamily serine protease
MPVRATAPLLLVLAMAIVAGCGGAGNSPARTPQADAPLREVASLVRALAPSIVTVEVETPSGWQGGTGVVWSSTGLIVTANHVVEDAERVLVRDARRRENRASVVAVDEALDLALLRVRRNDLVPARFAAKLPHVGVSAVTIGRPPFGGGLRWDLGQIESLHAAASRMRGLDDLVQSDGDVRHGDSGGALAGSGPVVFGIVLASDLEGGFGQDSVSPRTYAVPATLVRSFVEGTLHGTHREPGFLGIDAADVTPELEARHHLEMGKGVVVMAVEPGTPADRAGLRYRDAIVAINGTPIGRLTGLDTILRRSPAGSRITISFLRDGKPRTVGVALARRP